MRYNFEIRKDKVSKIGLAPIRLVVKHEKIRIRKNLEVKSALDDWDSETETIVYSKNHPFAKEYKEWNKALFEIKDKVDNIFEFFKYNNIEFSEKEFLDRFESNNKSVAIDFFQAFDEYIYVCKNTKAKSTIKKITTCKHKIFQFKDFVSS